MRGRAQRHDTTAAVKTLRGSSYAMRLNTQGRRPLGAIDSIRAPACRTMLGGAQGIRRWQAVAADADVTESMLRAMAFRA